MHDRQCYRPLRRLYRIDSDQQQIEKSNMRGLIERLLTEAVGVCLLVTQLLVVVVILLFGDRNNLDRSAMMDGSRHDVAPWVKPKVNMFRGLTGFTLQIHCGETTHLCCHRPKEIIPLTSTHR